MRRLGVVAALLLLSTAAACGASHGGTPSTPRGGTASSPGAIWSPNVISIPTGNLSPFYQCMLANGWKITAVQSTAPGEPPKYDMTRDASGIDPQEAMAQDLQCEALQPSPVPMTDDEIRAIYNEWVDEYHCLIGLGYQPDPPPSVETFVASYRPNGSHTGPWFPEDGVDTQHWTQAQYDEAKAKCTLSYFDMQW